MKILLIKGGWSPEREISLAGAKNIAQALAELGHSVTELDLLEGFNRLAAEARSHDFAFINLHGAPGEDGLPQARLDCAGCPYQGSDAVGSFIALNKAAAKQLYRLHGIPTPAWHFLPEKPENDWRPEIAWPIFVKSNTGVSSLGLYKAKNSAELTEALDKLFLTGSGVIMETCQQGMELSCAVLGNRALPPVLIEPLCGDFFDFESKYKQNGAREICPAPIDADLIEKCGKLALSCHNALGLYGISRTDMILNEKGEFTVLETNTLPGMTKTSIVPREAAAAGLCFNDLIAELIRLGLERKIGCV